MGAVIPLVLQLSVEKASAAARATTRFRSCDVPLTLQQDALAQDALSSTTESCEAKLAVMEAKAVSLEGRLGPQEQTCYSFDQSSRGSS